MAIQNRRGKYADFNPGKAVAGEWLIVQEDDPSASDGAAAYIAFKSGQTKRIATYQDMVDNLEEAVEEATAAAAASATLSESYAKGGTNSRAGEETDNAKYYKEQAGTSASTASTQALKSEGYAVGKQNGTAVESGSDYYQNNAKYYKDQAGVNAQTAATAKDAAETAKTAAQSAATSAEISKDAAEAIAQSMSAQSGVSGTIRIDGVLYATYCFVENGIPYTRLSEIVET